MTLGDVLSICGLVVGVIGFGFTIHQLRRTATATEASNELLVNVGARMKANHLLVLLPQLHLLSDELDEAVLTDDKKAVTRALVSYSRAASQIASMLDTSSESPELVDMLRESAKAAGTAKGVIVGGTNKSLAVVVKSVTEAMSTVSNNASELISSYQAKVS